MKEIYTTRTIIISFLILYMLFQLLIYYNCLLLVHDLDHTIYANSGAYGREINLKNLISVSKEYGIYENAYKTAFTKIGIAFSVLIIYIIFIYRNRNKIIEIK